MPVHLIPHQWEVPDMMQSYCYHYYLTEESPMACPCKVMSPDSDVELGKDSSGHGLR